MYIIYTLCRIKAIAKIEKIEGVDVMENVILEKLEEMSKRYGKRNRLISLFYIEGIRQNFNEYESVQYIHEFYSEK